MAEESLKDFTTTWIIGGLLLFCLLAFAITFMYNNNPTGLNDGTNTILENAYNNYSSKLTKTSEDSNTLLNITANTNPELSSLGSRDSVAVSFDAKSTSSSFWSGSRQLVSWVFSGTVGNILLGVMGGLFGFLALFYIWRFIRAGQ